MVSLFYTFFLIGLFTFGGGYAMLPMIQAEVLKNGWLTNEDLVNFIAVSESTPGPFAVNISTYVGMETAGPAGAFAATLGVVLPSFLLILIIAKSYDVFRESRLVKGVMSGLKPAVVGMIGSALISVGQSVFFPSVAEKTVFCSADFWGSAVLFFGMIFLAFKKVHPILIICISATFGILFQMILG